MNESTETTSQIEGYIGIPMTKVHHFYVSGEIEDASKYTEWFQIIRSASPHDIIYLHLNSEGGDAFTAIQFMRVLSESEATVITSAEGFCASAATMLFLCGDQCEVSDHAVFMFHTFSSFSYGKSSEMFAQVTMERSWGEKMVTDIYKGFFNEDEITALLDGKDYWMEGAEVVERLTARKALLEAPEKPVKKARARKK